MRGIELVERSRIAPSDPNRADVALFVGFVRRREGQRGELDGATLRWLFEQRWIPSEPTPALRAHTLLDLPVPIDAWDQFERWFAWEHRGRGTRAAERAPTYLGACVRSFFAGGGRRCYVVRCGDPWACDAPSAVRRARFAEVLPDYPARYPGEPAHRAGWRGLAHVLGLADVSFVAFPDLCDAVAEDLAALPDEREVAREPEGFRECSEPADAPVDRAAARIAAPRCDDESLTLWAKHLATGAEVLRRHAREAQLVAAVPLPASSTARGSLLARDPLRALREFGRLDKPVEAGGCASAFVQLVYPWLRTPRSGALPGGLESPEGAWLGLLARNALARGSYRSVAGQRLGDVHEVVPVLGREQLDGTSRETALVQRVSVLGPSPGAWRALSDVTTALDRDWRPAALSRLMAAMLRAARRLGEELAFEASSERTWARVVNGLGELLLDFLRAGALHGESAEQAFSVRCDRTTMTQNDIDAGRVIAVVSFSPAPPIERISVVLTLADGGASLAPAAEVAA